MCWERFTIDAAPGSAVTNTRARTGAILSIDDPRLDDVNDPAIRRRRRVLAVVGKHLPATTVHLGHDAPFDQGRFLPMRDIGRADDIGDTCTDVNGWFMTVALRANGPYAGGSPTNRAYVRHDGSSLPSVGDTYILTQRRTGLFRHVGIIVQVNLHEREFWITADGGQGFPLGPHPRLEREDVRDVPELRHQSAYLVPRTSWCEDGERGRLFLRHYYDRDEKGGFVLSGWVDIGHPSVQFRNDEMDAYGTDADFEDLRRRVRRVDTAAKSGRSGEWLEADNAAAAKGAYDPVTL